MSEIQTHKGELPFQVSHGFLIVAEGRIGPLGQLRFILDTGATHSVVDRKIAEKLRLPRLLAVVLNINRTVELERATFPDVQFGPVLVRNVPMLVADLASFSDFATHVDALIGMDLLRLNNITIDNQAAKILFDPPEPVQSDSVIQENPICITANLMLGDKPVRLVVDTGVQGILLYADRLVNRIPELSLENKPDVYIGRRMRGREVQVPNVHLGGVKIDHTLWLVKKGPPTGVLPGIDGLLGTSTLKARWIKFDFGANILSWEVSQ